MLRNNKKIPLNLLDILLIATYNNLIGNNKERNA